MIVSELENMATYFWPLPKIFDPVIPFDPTPEYMQLSWCGQIKYCLKCYIAYTIVQSESVVWLVLKK